jgi:GIY-YIG catalytic domain
VRARSASTKTTAPNTSEKGIYRLLLTASTATPHNRPAMVYTAQEDRCLVYVAWAPNGECIYVGRSFVGLHRFARHEALDANREQIQIIELNWCKDRQEAIDLEKQLIRKHEPKVNQIRYRVKPNRKKYRRHLNLKTYLLKLDSELYSRWKKAADAKGLTVSEFIRSSVNEAIK